MTSHGRSAKSSRPIVILGCPRSGTTLLSAMLHSHARIAVAPETRFLTGTYLTRERFGDLRKRNNRRKLAMWITRPAARFGSLRIDREAVVSRIVNGPPTLGSAFAAVWEEFAAQRGKQRWGEKRPHYFQWTSMILRLFPDAQLVAIFRDPRACVASLVAASWWNTGFAGALTAWIRSDWYLRRYARRAAEGQYYEVRYEDLVLRTREELIELCAFLEEDFDEAMLDHTSAADDMLPPGATDHSSTRTPLDPSRIEMWRSALTREQIGLIELVCRRAMRRHGYEPSGVGVRPSLKLVLHFAKVLSASQYGHATTFWRDALRRNRGERPLAAIKPTPTEVTSPIR